MVVERGRAVERVVRAGGETGAGGYRGRVGQQGQGAGGDEVVTAGPSPTTSMLAARSTGVLSLRSWTSSTSWSSRKMRPAVEPVDVDDDPAPDGAVVSVDP